MAGGEWCEVGEVGGLATKWCYLRSSVGSNPRPKPMTAENVDCLYECLEYWTLLPVFGFTYESPVQSRTGIYQYEAPCGDDSASKLNGTANLSFPIQDY